MWDAKNKLHKGVWRWGTFACARCSGDDAHDISIRLRLEVILAITLKQFSRVGWEHFWTEPDIEVLYLNGIGNDINPRHICLESTRKNLSRNMCHNNTRILLGSTPSQCSIHQPPCLLQSRLTAYNWNNKLTSDHEKFSSRLKYYLDDRYINANKEGRAIIRETMCSFKNLKTFFLLYDQTVPYLESDTASDQSDKPGFCYISTVDEKVKWWSMTEDRFRRGAVTPEGLAHFRKRCPWCSKKFANNNGMWRHVRLKHTDKAGELAGVTRNWADACPHTGLSCDICGIWFSYREDMEEHREAHFDGQPYGCSICLMSFACYREAGWLHKLNRECLRPLALTEAGFIRAWEASTLELLSNGG